MTLFENHGRDTRYNELKNACSTLTAVSSFSQDAYDKYTESNVSATLKNSGGSYGGGSETIVTTKCKPKYTVRKLTPVECARLQGFPDWWCDNI